MWIFTDNDDYNKSDCEEVWWENEIPETIFEYDNTDDDSSEIPEETPFYENDTFGHKLISWVLIFVLRLQAKHYLSDAAILSILKFIYAVLLIIDKKNGYHLAKIFRHQNIHCLSILNCKVILNDLWFATSVIAFIKEQLY